MERNFKTKDPFNLAAAAAASKQDLDLDYLIYSTNVLFGDLTVPALQYTFTAVNVNFDYFNEVSTGAVNSFSSLAALTSLLFLLNW